MQLETTMRKDGRVIHRGTYAPMGVSHDLQQDITKLLHQITVDKGIATLAEMGYLNMCAIGYVVDHVELKLFFAPELATMNDTRINGASKAIPNKALNAFRDYLFIGDVADNISFTNMVCPKYRVEEDALGEPAIVIKDGKGFKEDTEVMVLHCNLDLVLAAIFDINLALVQDFQISYETIGAQKKEKNEEATAGIMITMGANQEFPVKLTVSWADPFSEEIAETGATGHYEPDVAMMYLIGKMQSAKEVKTAKKQLAQKVSDSAERMVKQNDEKLSFWKKFR